MDGNRMFVLALAGCLLMFGFRVSHHLRFLRLFPYTHSFSIFTLVELINPQRKLIFKRKEFREERFSHFRNFFYYGNFNFKFFTLLVRSLVEGFFFLGCSIERNSFQQSEWKVYQMAFLFVLCLESKSFKGSLGYRITLYFRFVSFWKQ